MTEEPLLPDANLGDTVELVSPVGEPLVSVDSDGDEDTPSAWPMRTSPYV